MKKDKQPTVVVSVECDTNIAKLVNKLRKPIQKFLFGTYSDGSSRNLVDALNGEYISPKDKAWIFDMKKKHHKKRK